MFHRHDPARDGGVLRVVLLRAAGVVFLLLASAGSSLGDEPTEVLQHCGTATVGATAPWLSGWTLDQDVFNLVNARKETGWQRLALVFWQTTCLPCRQGLERLRDAATELAEDGVRVLLVNCGEAPEQVRAFTKAHHLEFEVLLDPFGLTEQSYLNQQSLPRTVIVARSGHVLEIYGREGSDYVERVRGR